MTRYEKLKAMPKEDFAAFICDMIGELDGDQIYWCDYCPAKRYCQKGHNGMVDYLNEEVEA